MWKLKQELPYKIVATVEKLKEEYGCYIAVRKIKNGYYLYKEMKAWNSKHNVQKLKTEYLGSITQSGTFKKSSSSYKLNLENAIKFIESHGGKVQMSETSASSTENEPEEIETKILTCLSMNSRLTTKRIAAIAEIKTSTAYSKIKNIEKQRGIEYTVQLYMPPIGYSGYMIFMKFIDDKPDNEDLKRVFFLEPKVQYAVLTKGEYEIIAYLLDTSPYEAEKTAARLRESEVLADYKAVVYTSPIAQKYGYVHIRDEFFSGALTNKVWRRTKGAKIKDSDELLQREFQVLKELNNDGKADFSEIDQKYGLGRGASFYTYRKLKERGIISTTTINLSSLNIKYFGIMTIKRIQMSEYAKTRHHLYLDVINEFPHIINKYSLICEVGAPDSVVAFLPVIGDESIEDMASILRAKLRGVEISTSIVTSGLVGHICLRKFDNRYASYYNNLLEMKKQESGNRISYES